MYLKNIDKNIIRHLNHSRGVQFENRCSSHIQNTYSVPTAKSHISYFDADSPTRADDFFFCWQRESFFFFLQTVIFYAELDFVQPVPQRYNIIL